MLIFGITTTTKLASLSLNDGDKVLGEIKIEVAKTHSTTILEQIDKLFKWSGKRIEEVEKVLVSVGPGSFTGVRIAISVVKGLFYGKNVEIYSVNELEALAYQCLITEKNSINKGDIIYSLIDSGKEKIYYGKYLVVNDVQLKSLQEDEVGKIGTFTEEIKEINFEKCKVFIVGDGVLNYKERLKELLSGDVKCENVKFTNDNNLKINASIFYKMYGENILKREDIFTLKPEYLEKSQAERDKKNGI